MALRDMDEKGNMRRMTKLDHEDEFNAIWNGRFTDDERRAMIEAVDGKLNELINAPDKQWGSIMNTSIEGGKVNPFNGRPGDWSGTPWHPIWVAHGYSDQQAALFFGNLWKWRIIEHDEEWVGVRNTPDTRPTFPSHGVTLGGKTYFRPDRTTGR
jgi:hypothetical protein